MLNAGPDSDSGNTLLASAVPLPPTPPCRDIPANTAPAALSLDPGSPRTSSSFLPSLKLNIRRPGSRSGIPNGIRRSEEPTSARTPTDSLHLNKALPPPPELKPFPCPRSAVSDVDVQAEHPPLGQRSTSFTAYSLVHAALNVGVPPVLPHPLNLSGEVPPRPASYAPITPVSPPPHSQFQPPIPTSPARRTSNEYRRKRGLSLAPALELFTSNSTKAPPPNELSPPAASPHLSRRHSFWRLRANSQNNSKRSESALSHAPSPSPVGATPQQLPTIRAGLPTLSIRFSSEVSFSSPNLPSPTTATGLRRRHSARESSLRAQPPPSSSTTIHETHQTDFSGTDGRSYRGLMKSMMSLTTLNDVSSEVQKNRSSTESGVVKQLPYLKMNSRPRSPTFIFTTSPLSSNANSYLDLTSPTSEQGERAFSIDSLSPPATAVPNQDELQIDQLIRSTPKTEIAAKLASSVDEFHSKGLKRLMDRFDFAWDPIDIALRKLLMEFGLPKETQQIDRVIEAFSQRYSACNPDLFLSSDHPYILAFSLIMLHTDAFNKSNKKKMTKPDYVKNTRVPGIPSELLEYLFDNILFAPFIFIEEPANPGSSYSTLRSDSKDEFKFFGEPRALSTTDISLSMRPKTGKVDAYFMIANNMLSSLRVNVDDIIPPFDPFRPFGTLETWDEKELRQTFEFADYIEVGAKSNVPDNQPLPSPSAGVGYTPTSSPPSIPPSETTPGSSAPWVLRVTKVGLLDRKDDVVDGGKRSAIRKWRQWSVILTATQLLFFRDTTWASALMEQKASGELQQSLLPHSAFLRPDELVSLHDTVAVFDTLYTKHPNTIRFILPSGKHILLRSANEHNINEWAHLINYASAFRTAGVRMRTGLKTADQQPVGETVSVSEAPQSLSSSIENDSASADDDRISVASSCPSPTREALRLPFPRVDSQRITPPITPPETPILPARADNAKTQPLSVPRMTYLKAKIEELDSRIRILDGQLQEHLRLSRNIATLTPFLKSTRDKLQAHALSLSKRVLHSRLDLAKVQCHRRILAADLESTRRDEEASQHRHKLTRNASFYALFSSRTPTATLVDGANVQWNNSSTVLGMSVPALPRTSSSVSRTSLWGDGSPDSRSQSFSDRDPLLQGPVGEQRNSSDEGEQAEEWYRTRAGHRVSLVDVPPGLGQGWLVDR